MTLLRKLTLALKHRGIKGTMQTIVSKVIPVRVGTLKIYREALADKAGLEIGGPTAMFADNGELPVYSVVRQLDNCNFSSTTIWEGTLQEGTTFRFHPNKPPGRQYISEAAELKAIDSASYDFVISSNTIEHTANPLKALLEWKRLIKDNGYLLLVVPHRDATFDHNRPITSLQHIKDDYEQNMDEGDLTHLDKILALHDLEMDPAAGDLNSFRERSKKNVENRCLHHHVFDSDLVVKLVDHIGMQILSVDPSLPFYIIVLAQKVTSSSRIDNQPFLLSTASYRRKSPFKSDRT